MLMADDLVMQNAQTIVSEKAVLLWIIMCAIATIASVLLGGVIIYFISLASQR